jgi:hypothetical protein
MDFHRQARPSVGLTYFTNPTNCEHSIISMRYFTHEDEN